MAPRAIRRAAAFAVFALSLLPLSLQAEPSAQKTADPAVKLFEEGLALLDAGDCERALDYFLRSRALSPGKGNTTNAAHCLHELGRYDEALELYEELVSRFAAELSPENRRLLVPAMQSLLGRVGAVVVTANVEGSLLVDGRPRGKLPLSGPVRVLGGRRVVRVLKDGYAPFERVVEVAISDTARIDAVLKPLAQAGQLRLEDPDNEGAEVFVDRVRVGAIPWEGTLGPGEHLVWEMTAERGSAPARAIVVQGQMATLRLRSARLGPVATFSAEPASAELRLDGVSLGAGQWTGRLPLGAHELIASEAGYFTRSARFEETEPGGVVARVNLKLDVDAAHPRWPRRPIGQLEIGLLAGLAAGGGLGSDAEAWCGGSWSRGVLGAVVGARAGFRFPFGLSVEIAGGYLTLGASFSRRCATSFTNSGKPVPLAYQLADALRLSGPFVAGGAGYRLPLGGRFSLVSRAMVGAIVGAASDPVHGTAATAAGSAPVSVSGQGERPAATSFFVQPALDLDARLGNLHLGAGLSAMFVLTRGPAFEHASLQVDVPHALCTPHEPAALVCVPVKDVVANEQAFRPFAVVVPALSAGYDF